MNIVKSVFHKRWKSQKRLVRFFERINVLTKLKRYGIIKAYTLILGVKILKIGGQIGLSQNGWN